MVGTDSVFVGAKPSPRTYGSFPRILGQFVRDEALLGLEEAVHRMTGMPAARLGLRDRGTIRDGAVADLVVFDPATVRSDATIDDPTAHPDGIEHVIVAGTLVDRRRPADRAPGPDAACAADATDRATRVADGASTGRRRARPASAAPPWRRSPDACRIGAGPSRPSCLRVPAGRIRPAVAPRRGAARPRRRRRRPIRSARISAQPIDRRRATAPAASQRSQRAPDPLDVVDRLDLVGLDEQDPEPGRAEPGEWSAARAWRRIVVGDRRDEPLGRGRRRPARRVGRGPASSTRTIVAGRW